MATKAAKVGALKEKGMRLANQGRLPEAETVFLDLLSLSSRDVDALLALGTLHGMQGNYTASEKYLGKAISINPGLPAAWYSLGMAQKHQGNLEGAAASYRKAIGHNPRIAGYHNNLGNVLVKLNDPDGAIGCFKRALELEPDSPDYYYNLGNALKARGLRHEAVNAFNNALGLRPGFAAALKELGTAYHSLGAIDKAEECFRTVIESAPDDYGAVAGLAKVFASRREFEQACSILEPCLCGTAPSAPIAIAFAGMARHTGREAEAVSLLVRVLNSNKQLSKDDRAQIHFRLGHFYDGIKKYTDAFHHFRKGNELRSSAAVPDDCASLVDSIIDSFSRDFCRNAPRPDHPTDLAVFIVGMPRSGTTLVEQIIASHPRAHGAGELDILPSLLNSIPQLVGAENIVPEGLKLLDQDHVTALSEKYTAQLKSLAPEAKRITDKLPGNFMNLGFIRLLFPGARIIHCRRAPLDTCLSCYFQDFAGHHPYATDLEATGKYYLHYERLMKHWRDVLDIEILEVDYEELVNNLESVCREIIAFCGLEWNPACLEFHNNSRIVVTASSDQVNSPLYSSAVDRWKNYEDHIGLLKRVLASLDPQR
ncbi:MAG: sulfotransferase [Thiogranum sp.]